MVAANSSPAGEPPACTSTGQPCGGRGCSSAPRTEKNWLLVIERLHLRPIDEHAAGTVGPQSIVFPAVP